MRRDWSEIADAAPDGEGSRGGDASMPKRELYNEATNAGIEHRSAMTKEQLVEALSKRRATSLSRQPATREAPGRRPRTRHHPRSERGPAGEIGSAEVARPQADARRSDRCAIVYNQSARNGEFLVVVPDTGGSPSWVARSPAFSAPRFGPVRRWGPARVAHDLLVSRLEACGWWAVDAGGTWYELAFVRLRGEGERSRRSLVTVVRQAGQARFVAEELDSYGNPTPLVVSAPFSAPRFRRVRPSMGAKAELTQLVRRMESDGWRAGAVGKDWYAVSLWRPVSTTRAPRAPGSRPGRPAGKPA